MKNTNEEFGYKFIKVLGPQSALFMNVETGIIEEWTANADNANSGFSWCGADWEFVCEYKEANQND